MTTAEQIKLKELLLNAITGHNHPSTLNSIGDLAAVLQSRENFEAAEATQPFHKL
jgi:hypothetical protein